MLTMNDYNTAYPIRFTGEFGTAMSKAQLIWFPS